MKFYVDKFPISCALCPLHSGIKGEGYNVTCGILPQNKNRVSACFRPQCCPLRSKNEQIKIETPKRLTQHVLTVKAFLDAGVPIEAAVHQVAAIYELEASDKNLLYLVHYYEQRDKFAELIDEYEREIFGEEVRT